MTDSPTSTSQALQWILCQYAPKTGRDHLGLNEVNSGGILASLSPSVNVLTVHPRYHSFYCFVLKRCWQTRAKVSRNGRLSSGASSCSAQWPATSATGKSTARWPEWLAPVRHQGWREMARKSSRRTTTASIVPLADRGSAQ